MVLRLRVKAIRIRVQFVLQFPNAALLFFYLENHFRNLKFSRFCSGGSNHSQKAHGR